ncbi:MAG: transglutaminase domain-containing protein [Mediterranea sp.]|jgi:transglutaminase-like putative cysteine protease|nr:transglutaminase domain-containing protein [Mediterranea sp.]
MKKVTYLFFVPLLSAVLCSCGGHSSHFLKDESYRGQVLLDLEQKEKALPNGDLFAILSDASLSTYEREALEFLYAYMPIGDITDYSGSYYLENLRQSEQTRQEMPWGKTITDNLFRHFVLPIRVNNENLDDSRKVFYAELKDRVKGLSMKDAILEVNHWCHEKVVYRPSDSRTSSPLATVKTAYGRCGEESTFTVAALRAVGIPARQVYTPRWAHTDDNHAWVEAWADGKWYFFGACEPEPVLNLGWFNAPASRGMLMHTKVFGRYTGPEEVMLQTANATEINVIDNYAPSAKATVVVTDADGKPVVGAKVEFKVYNYGEFYTVGTKYTDESGQTFLTAGKGDMLVWASAGGHFGFAKLSFGKQPELKITLDRKEGDDFSMDFDIVPPPESAHLPEVTPEQRAENDRRMASEDSIRNAYVATFPDSVQIETVLTKLKTELTPQEKKTLHGYIVDARGNYDVLIRFIREADGQGKLAKGSLLLGTLSAKDCRDVAYDVLMDHFAHTDDALAVAHAMDIYRPRILNEMLTPYRSFFQSQFSAEEAEAFRANPQTLVEWVAKNVAIDTKYNTQRIPVSPEGVWRSRVADARSRDIFFVAIARSLNIPAYVRSTDRRVMYEQEDASVKPQGRRAVEVDFDKKEAVEPTPARYCFTENGKVMAANDDRLKYYSKFTISRIEDGSPRLMDCDEENPELRNMGTLSAGYYLLVTGTRLASGSVLAHVSSFTLQAAPASDRSKLVTTDVPFNLRQSGEQVAVIGNFNSESLFAPVSNVGKEYVGMEEEQSLLQACGRGYFVVGILGSGQEPTNHALRDIAALKSDLEKWGRKMVLLFPDEAGCRKLQLSEFPALPSTVTYGIDTHGICAQIVEAMKLNHKGSLPVFIIADTFNRVVFVSQGYTIGLGEQLMKVVKGL